MRNSVSHAYADKAAILMVLVKGYGVAHLASLRGGALSIFPRGYEVFRPREHTYAHAVLILWPNW